MNSCTQLSLRYILVISQHVLRNTTYLKFMNHRSYKCKRLVNKVKKYNKRVKFVWGNLGLFGGKFDFKFPQFSLFYLSFSVYLLISFSNNGVWLYDFGCYSKTTLQHSYLNDLAIFLTTSLSKLLCRMNSHQLLNENLKLCWNTNVI